MKTRIKKVEWEDHTYYYPQRKGLFFWKYYYKNNFARQGYRIVFNSKLKAEDYIKNHKDWPITTYSYEDVK